MEHGLSDITVDIWDPRLPPDIENTRIMCRTCNTEKGAMTPEEWAERKRCWRLWKENQKDPANGTLFEGLNDLAFEQIKEVV
jgi:hypothetical protein